MTAIGNHIKTNVHKSQRERVRTLYLDLLQCKPAAAPMPDLDLFVFENDFVLGVFYFEDEHLLTEAEHLNAAWLEIKTKDVVELKRRLLAFGVKEVDYPDKTRFFFQAPGGQVFRLAPEDGGI
jgi:hypothetical protein